jgi:hypothetical protein
MTAPRFTIRLLLALVLIVGLLLAVGVLSVQNRRLRVENARLQAESPLMLSFEEVSRPATQFSETVTLDTIPGGPDGFGKERRIPRVPAGKAGRP